MNFLDAIAFIIFPSSCISCGKKSELLCSLCARNLPQKRETLATWIHPIFVYRNKTVREIIHRIKYKRTRKLCDILTPFMLDTILEELEDKRLFKNFIDPIMIPIPLSRGRYCARGFNQSELIVRSLEHEDGGRNFIVRTDILTKVHETEHQTKLKTRNERLSNLKNSFKVCKPSDIKKRNIILIDDVTTTGATLEEARRVLLRAGARQVEAFTLAH